MLKTRQPKPSLDRDIFKFRARMSESIQSLQSTRLTYDQAAEVNKMIAAVKDLLKDLRNHGLYDFKE
jgi:hypothetical protein